MEYNYYLLSDKFNILNGYGSFSIKSSDNADENCQYTKAVKILGLSHIKSYIQNGRIDESRKTVQLSHIYEKLVNYVQKNDIVLTRITVSDEIDVLYINQQPDNCVYHNSVIVLRAKSEEINTKFIYLMLKRMAQKHNLLKTILISNESGHRTLGMRLPITITKKMLMNLKLKEYSIEKQNEVVRQYEKIERQRLKLNKAENDLFESIDTMLK